MTEKQLKSVMDSITMPEAMAQELRKNVSGKKQKNRTFRYPKIAAAVIAGALILSVGTTSYAVYQAKNLRVFFEFLGVVFHNEDSFLCFGPKGRFV